MKTASLEASADWEAVLNIHTLPDIPSSWDDKNHYPYEPTPYSVLERLAESGYISMDNTLIDYGCGKGRVGLFLSRTAGCRSIGVEYDADICRAAAHNAETAGLLDKASFFSENAEEFTVPAEADCFYFFNPFSTRLLSGVISRIMESFYESPRHLQFFFYYPTDEYTAWLMTESGLDFVDEIDCTDLFSPYDINERIFIFEYSCL